MSSPSRAISIENNKKVEALEKKDVMAKGEEASFDGVLGQKRKKSGKLSFGRGDLETTTKDASVNILNRKYERRENIRFIAAVKAKRRGQDRDRRESVNPEPWRETYAVERFGIIDK